ncbi:Mycobacteriophage protein Gp1 (partial) [Frankia alni ACN14a]|uniref:Mycobacteriophage protein Gp1 (Partial) n=1 Tax=Frankia alni (strain DSM 45986 / CECT 9034 / ACN14a) TaxID=326424 RepID=Q0RM57_FRAAA|nr:Mycobacteriophage protein Gp1 (partial) [Frankia alni ACN14a]
MELGRRRRAFSGTDALPMDAVVAAERYVRSGQAARETALLLGEGARLGCARFLAAAVAGGWTVELVYLHGTEVAAQRRAGRAAGQDERWVRGAATRARRLAEGPPAGVLVHRVDVAAEVTLPDVPGLFDAGLCA